jgi:hypothetical protein
MLLSGGERAKLEVLNAISNLAERRAMWWNHLAETVLQLRGSDRAVVRYRELVTDPARVVGDLLKGWPKGDLGQPLGPLRMRENRSALDAEDEEAIEDICSRTARLVGLQ